MTLLLPLILGTLLSTLTSGVDAKSKSDQIRLYQFVTDSCEGGPHGANIDIKRGHCVNLDARSIKPRMDEKRMKWIDDINTDVNCYLVVYNQPRCLSPEPSALAMMSLPTEIDDCYTVDTSDTTIRSAKFICDAKEHVFVEESTSTETVTFTSFSIGPDNVPTPHTTMETQTFTTSHPETVTDLGGRGLDSRAGENSWVWMLHPWSGTPLCYQCITKKPGQYDWVKCLSTHNSNKFCGAKPVGADGEALTSTTTVTTTVTNVTTTVAATRSGTSVETVTVTLPVPASGIAERSWHKDVHFRLPWDDHRRMCADAEWEKRGTDKWEIRLQDVHSDDGNDCTKATGLDLADVVVETATVTADAIDTTTLSGWATFSTKTLTLYTAVLTSTITATQTASTTSSTSTTELKPVVVEITTPITTSAIVTQVTMITTTSTIIPEPPIEAEARAEAPPHRDL